MNLDKITIAIKAKDLLEFTHLCNKKKCSNKRRFISKFKHNWRRYVILSAQNKFFDEITSGTPYAVVEGTNFYSFSLQK
jgi:hypothetical protein